VLDVSGADTKGEDEFTLGVQVVTTGRLAGPAFLFYKYEAYMGLPQESHMFREEWRREAILKCREEMH
jgi:hypothetical protein